MKVRLKRMKAGARGRFKPRVRRYSHLTVVLDERESEVDSMGRKVNPIGFRLKINRDWEARWFAEGTRYSEMLHEDFAIRRFFKETRTRGYLARSRSSAIQARSSVTIFTAKPGIVIGRKGEAVKKIRPDSKC